jgi:hypothetical protein
MDYGKFFKMNFYSTASGSFAINCNAFPSPNFMVFSEFMLQAPIGGLNTFRKRAFFCQGMEYKERDFSLKAAVTT